MRTKSQDLTHLFGFLIAVVFVTIATHLNARPVNPVVKTQKEQQSIFDFISHSDIIEMTLTTDLQRLLKDNRNSDYQEATLSFEDSEGNTIVSKIKVRQRGKYRRRICDFPPLKLDFSKKALKKAGLNPQFDDMKLVTHCLDTKSASKETVLKEFLAYQLYNEISEDSYRVQLIKITYIDSQSNKKIKNRYGFLIEDVDELAARMNGEECEMMNLPQEELNANSENTVAVFQYMIGNEDWNISMLRNVKLIKNTNSQKAKVVPYDFDFSGFVDAPYAIPNPDVKLVSVKDRAFLGRRVGEESMKRTLAIFQNKEEVLINKVKNFKYLKKSTRKELVRYLASFYDILEKHHYKEVEMRWTNAAPVFEESFTSPKPLLN